MECLMTFRFKLDFPAFSVKQGLNHHSLPVGCCITGPGGEGDIVQGIPEGNFREIQVW